MPNILLVKNLGSLRPVDDLGEEYLQKLGQGEIITATLRKSRSGKRHRFFFGLLSLVHQQLDRKDYPTVETLLTEAKIITGHYDRRDILVEGKRYPVLVPKSIAYSAMDDVEFSHFIDRVIAWIVKDILPGVKESDLREEIEIMVGAE